MWGYDTHGNLGGGGGGMSMSVISIIYALKNYPCVFYTDRVSKNGFTLC